MEGCSVLPQEQEPVQSLAERCTAHIPEAFIRPPHQRPSVPHDCFTTHIPVIDLTDWLQPGEARSRIILEVGQACSEWGFFQVVNHGVPLEILDRMRQVGAQFFALPVQEKLRFACKPGIAAAEGYGSRMLVREDQVLDWRDYFDHHTLPLSRMNPDNWPEKPALYRKSVEEYSEHMRILAQRLLTIISESLGLSPSYIGDAIGEPYQNISLNYYPPCPQYELTLGLQAHSDLGAITLLMQDEVGGLQVSKDGQWIAVQPIPNALVVNLADQIQILTNGRYKSVEHRAVVNSVRARISVATFYDPSRDRVISPAPKLIDEDHPLSYRNVLFGDHVSAWYYKGPEGKNVVDSLAIEKG
eukprot:c22933_g2_i1 orf=920-1990(+)